MKFIERYLTYYAFGSDGLIPFIVGNIALTIGLSMIFIMGLFQKLNSA